MGKGKEQNRAPLNVLFGEFIYLFFFFTFDSKINAWRVSLMVFFSLCYEQINSHFFSFLFKAVGRISFCWSCPPRAILKSHDWFVFFGRRQFFFFFLKEMMSFLCKYLDTKWLGRLRQQTSDTRCVGFLRVALFFQLIFPFPPFRHWLPVRFSYVRAL